MNPLAEIAELSNSREGFSEVLKPEEIVVRQRLVGEFKKRRDHLIEELTLVSAEQRKSASKTIFAVIRIGSLAELHAKLLSGTYTVEERDYNEATPLHIAAFEGREDVVGLLLSFFADPFAVDKDNMTAADLAVRRNHPAIARQIMNAGKRRRFSLNVRAGSQKPGDQSPLDPTRRGRGLSERRGSSLEDFGDYALGYVESTADLELVETSEFMLGEASTSSPITSSLEPEKLLVSRFCSIPDARKIVVGMVGLPGRGKSFISRRMARYLNWKGVPCRVFNAGDYRREILGSEQTRCSNFFDPTNPDGVQAREKMCELACCNVAKFLNGNEGAGVGILDATNTTKERRRKVAEYFFETVPGCHVLYVESICNDDSTIRENILRDKCGNEDWKDILQTQGADTVVQEFQHRIEQYKKKYECLDVSEGFPFMKILNVTQSYIVHRFLGPIPTRLTYFLLNQHPIAVPFMVTTPGETVWQRNGTFGGDNMMTEQGFAYAHWLHNYILERVGEDQKLTILTGRDKACEETTRVLLSTTRNSSLLSRSSPKSRNSRMLRNFKVVRLASLEGLRFGRFLGLTPEEAVTKWPRNFRKLFGREAANEIYRRANMPPDFELSASPSDPSSFITPGECLFLKPMMSHSPASVGSSPGSATNPALPAIVPHAYEVAFPRGESIRQLNMRLEGAFMQLLHEGNTVLIIAPMHCCQGIVSFMTDSLPEASCAIPIPLHTVIEVSPAGKVARKGMYPSLET